MEVAYFTQEQTGLIVVISSNKTNVQPQHEQDYKTVYQKANNLSPERGDGITNMEMM